MLNRRDFIKWAGLAGAAALSGGPALAEVEPSRRASRPNILVFLTDDHAQWAQHAYGNAELRTPTMDGLAARGVRMSQAFTTCPVCSPARASFFTGLTPSQHGIHDWLNESHSDLAIPGLGDQVLLPQLLKQAGYFTGLIGKWHCGQDWKPKPGFDRWFSYWADQFPHLGKQNFSDQGRHITVEGRQSSLLTDQVAAFLHDRAKQAKGGAKDSPFFLFVGYVDTHRPHTDAPADLVKSYAGATFGDIKREKFASCHGKALALPAKTEAEENARCAQYYAAASSIDREVGKVLDVLKETGVLDDTLIVYTADHGLNCGQHGIWEKGPSTMPQNFFEESIRIPCTISWPKGGIGQNAVCDDFVNHCDLWATLLEIAGATPDAAAAGRINSPGRSYLARLQGKSAEPRDWIISEYGNARMIRTGQYKLILRYPYKGVRFSNELYDLQADPRETKNIYADAAMEKVIGDLTGRIEDYFRKYEIPERSGVHLEKQPAFNANPPWELAARRATTAPHGKS